MSGKASGNNPQQLPLQLLAYTDASVAEGSEAEQLLACFPSSVSAEEQISATGLMQAICQFSASFSKDAPVQTITTQSRCWVLQQALPGLWLLLVARWQSLRPVASPSRLEAILHRLRELLILAVPAGDFIHQKAAVADVLEDFGRKLWTSTTGVAALLHNPLAPPTGVPALPLSPKLSTGAQCLLQRALNTPLWGPHAPSGGMLLFQEWVLAAQVEPAAACALHDLATMALLPAAETPSLTRRLAGAASRRRRQAQEQQRHSILHPATWQRLDSSFLVPSACSASSSTGAESEPDFRHAAVWLQGGTQEASLAAIQHSKCLLMLTLPAGSAHSGAQLAALSAALQGPLKQLATQAAEHFSTLRQGHLSGLRYSMVDELLNTCRASPPAKAAQLGQECQALVTNLDSWSGLSLADQSHEVIIRGSSSDWAVKSDAHDGSAVIAFEQLPADGLIGAHGSAEQTLKQLTPFL